MDPTDFRAMNFINADQFPYLSPTGFVYDSGDYHGAMDKAKEIIDYDGWRARQAEQNADPDADKLIGIGVASFTEVVGAGNSREFDILGLKMFDSAELRVHPTGKAILKLGVQTQGQGHETTFAQIVAEELGIPYSDIKVQYGDTDNTPYGLGTYASRSIPVGGAATAMVSRKLRAKGQKLAAHLLEAAEEDLEWEPGKFTVRGTDQSVTIQDVAFAAYTNHPEGMEAGLEGVTYYDPPNMTYPFGSYIAVVEVDTGDGTWKVLDMAAVDDCGVRINPMIVDGQITGGLTEGFAKANMQWITFDDDGNCIGSNFMDYLVPTAWETPKYKLGETVTPSPHHPIWGQGRGRVGHGGFAGRRFHQRGDRRSLVQGRVQHRHAGAPAPGVGRPQRGGGESLNLVVCLQNSLPCPACQRRPSLRSASSAYRCGYAFVGGPSEERRCRRMPRRDFTDIPLRM